MKRQACVSLTRVSLAGDGEVEWRIYDLVIFSRPFTSSIDVHFDRRLAARTHYRKRQTSGQIESH